MEKVGYLGPEGSYSHIAARTLRPNAELCGYSSFRLAVEALCAGVCSAVALPIENSLNGSVAQVTDLLQYTENIIAFEECVVKIDHRLAVLKGADYSGISRIYSHEQPLAQCMQFLLKNFPNAELIATQSTAASLEMLSSASDAAIVGAHCKRDGIELSPRNIADSNNNFTEFLLARKGVIDERVSTQNIFFSVTCRHKAGALLDILEPMRAGGLNMTKIQSRPLKDRAGEYRFFIEVEGDYSNAQVRNVLDGVKRISLSFKLLGAY